MSAREERPALTSRTTSLYDYALFHHGIEPHGRAPAHGYPVPGERPRSALRFREATRLLAQLLGPAVDDPDPVGAAATLDRRLPQLGVRPDLVQHPLARLPLTNESAALALGRQLVRTASDPTALGAGIHLVGRLGGPKDVPQLITLALLQGFLRPVVTALSALPCDTEVLIRLMDLLDPQDHGVVIDALTSREDPAARQWLLNLPVGPGTSSSRARHIAVAVRLADLLQDESVDASVLAQGARLLTRMALETSSPAEVLGYGPAIAVYETLVRRADRLPPTLDHHAILLSLALDLSSGASVLLDWPPGLREELLERLERLLGTPAWAAVPDGGHQHRDRYRADWIRRMRREPLDRTTPNGLRIHVVEHDPEIGGHVEARILLDGRPLVRLFPAGHSPSPEYVLGQDLLRATPGQGHSIECCQSNSAGALVNGYPRLPSHDDWSAFWRLTAWYGRRRHRLPASRR